MTFLSISQQAQILNSFFYLEGCGILSVGMVY